MNSAVVRGLLCDTTLSQLWSIGRHASAKVCAHTSCDPYTTRIDRHILHDPQKKHIPAVIN